MQHRIKVLPPFLLCVNRTELPGIVLIACAREPWIFGQVVTYESYEQMAKTVFGKILAENSIISHAVVEGYNICIQYACTIKGNYVPIVTNTLQQIDAIMKDMAEFFRREVLDNDPEMRLKYKSFFDKD